MGSKDTLQVGGKMSIGMKSTVDYDIYDLKYNQVLEDRKNSKWKLSKDGLQP